MPPQNTPVMYLTSPLIPVPHGMFACAGGVSDPPFSGLNLSYYTGDQADHVRENRRRMLRALGLSHLISVRQVHGDRVLWVEPQHLDTEVDGYDAIISTLPDTGVLIQQADCQAILLWAPDPGPIVAAIHSGWRGSVQNIIGTTIKKMRLHGAVDPATLHAAISPSLGPCCAEFINYKTELPTWMHAYQVRPHYFDFWAISKVQLQQAGVLEKNINVSRICTKCDPHYFSYRRAAHINGGITGRNGSVIGLPAETANPA